MNDISHLRNRCCSSPLSSLCKGLGLVCDRAAQIALESLQQLLVKVLQLLLEHLSHHGCQFALQLLLLGLPHTCFEITCLLLIACTARTTGLSRFLSLASSPFSAVQCTVHGLHVCLECWKCKLAQSAETTMCHGLHVCLNCKSKSWLIAQRSQCMPENRGHLQMTGSPLAGPDNAKSYA